MIVWAQRWKLKNCLVRGREEDEKEQRTVISIVVSSTSRWWWCWIIEAENWLHSGFKLFIHYNRPRLMEHLIILFILISRKIYSLSTASSFSLDRPTYRPSRYDAMPKRRGEMANDKNETWNFFYFKLFISQLWLFDAILLNIFRAHYEFHSHDNQSKWMKREEKKRYEIIIA